MTSKVKTIVRRALLVIQILLLLPIGWFLWHLVMPRDFASKTAEVLPLKLSTGPFQTLYYGTPYPKGIVIVATGDGGWSGQWEEPLAIHAAAAGYAVGGWDCRKFADSRKFTQPQLVEAFNAAVAAVREKAKLPADCPVWYTGWSTGAEWSIAAAASPEREKHLVGILPAAPGDRSRYGITQGDLLGLEPQGPDSYALADFAPLLKRVRIAQFAGELDPLDDVDWLRALTPETPHRVIVIPHAPHDMDRAGKRFLSEFDMAIQWTLDTPVPAAPH